MHRLSKYTQPVGIVLCSHGRCAGRSVLWDGSPQTEAANEVNCEGNPSPATPKFVQGGTFVWWKREADLSSGTGAFLSLQASLAFS